MAISAFFVTTEKQRTPGPPGLFRIRGRGESDTVKRPGNDFGGSWRNSTGSTGCASLRISHRHDMAVPRSSGHSVDVLILY